MLLTWFQKKLLAEGLIYELTQICRLRLFVVERFNICTTGKQTNNNTFHAAFTLTYPRCSKSCVYTWQEGAQVETDTFLHASEHVDRFAPAGSTSVTIYLFKTCKIPLNVAFQGFALMYETLRGTVIIYLYLSRCMPR